MKKREVPSLDQVPQYSREALSSPCLVAKLRVQSLSVVHSRRNASSGGTLVRWPVYWAPR